MNGWFNALIYIYIPLINYSSNYSRKEKFIVYGVGYGLPTLFFFSSVKYF